MSVPSAAGGGAAQPKAAVRTTQSITKYFNYTLVARPVPPGFSTYCPESNLVFWGQVDTSYFHPDPFSFAGGTGGLTVNVAPCNAATGNKMHAQLDVFYGHMRFVATGNGNFKLDSVDDSRALLTVTDNNTGYSSNTDTYLAF